MQIKTRNIDWQTIDYKQAWDQQEAMFAQKMKYKTDETPSMIENHLILCEHPHVFTLGKSGSETNVLFNPEMLKKIDATYYKINRGGDITYHGPGQLVGYPIIDLEQFGISVKRYVEMLEQAVIDTVAEYGIATTRLAGATGVWLDVDTPAVRKICAIGVKASRYITMHGFALNINTDLNYFNYINPCGFVDKGVTSLQKELHRAVDMAEVKRLFIQKFAKVFNTLVEY